MFINLCKKKKKIEENLVKINLRAFTISNKKTKNKQEQIRIETWNLHENIIGATFIH